MALQVYGTSSNEMARGGKERGRPKGKAISIVPQCDSVVVVVVVVTVEIACKCNL